jgi:hypothetical protein
MFFGRIRSYLLDIGFFRPSSLVVLGLALVILLLSTAQAAYRLSLPTDGWTFARDTTGAGMRLVLERNLSGLPSTLAPGDTILAIDRIPYPTLLGAAIASTPRRPQNWAVGQVVHYTVIRRGLVLEVPVTLLRLPEAQIVNNVTRSLLMDPGPLFTLLLALYVFFRRPTSGAARLLLVFAAAVFSSDSISQIVTGSNVAGPTEIFYLGAFWPAQFFSSLIWTFVIAPVFIQLFLSYPVRKGPLQRYPGVSLAVMVAFMPAVTLVIALLYLNRPLEFWDTWQAVDFVFFISVLLIAIAAMLHTLVTARGAKRRAQIRWVAWGTLITSLGALSGSVVVSLGLLEGNLLIAWIITRLLLLGYPVALAIAILRYRLFDIGVIINRTLVYGIVTVLLAMVYFGSVIIFQQVFQVFTGTTSLFAIVLSTLAISFLFIPARQNVQNFIDRRFYRRKYDALRTLEAFTASLQDEFELTTLTERLVEVVEETLQPNQVVLWLREFPGSPGQESSTAPVADQPDEPLVTAYTTASDT